MGQIKIFFGKVHSVLDESKILRCQIIIDGFTNELNPDDLPWYFPWYGINYLPLKDDIVPVLVFDDDFAMCFYGNKIHQNDIGISDDDYEYYLEIFKRTIGDELVTLRYTKTAGIEFINADGKIVVEKDKISFFVETNSIIVTKDKITLGDKNQEAVILGDKGVKQLEDMITHQNNVIIEMMKMFMAIQAAATPVPFTAGIGAALAPLTAPAQAALTPENAQLKVSVKQIQSKKVFTE
jgi:hypothetical protein